jgi:steroid delta-isomerase-like uncharacterized protein
MLARDLALAYFDAFNRRDAQAMLACLAEDVEHHVNQGGIRRGRDRFGEFLQHMSRCYEEQLEDLVIMTSEDNTRVAAEFTVVGRYKVTDEGLPEAYGQTYSIPAGSFMTIRGGKIARVTTYYNLADWTAQVSA